MNAEELHATVAELRQVGSDTQRLEVKAAGGGLPKSLAETICAFSNANGGLIILGLDEMTGFATVADFAAARVANQLKTLCEKTFDRPIRPQIDLLPFEGSIVLVAQIEGLHPKDKPCYIKERGGIYDTAYIRTGDGDHRLSGYEIDQLLANRGRPLFDREAVPQASLADFDQELLEKFLAKERSEHPRVFKGDTEKDLLKLQVLTREQDGRVVPTLAGLLAFAEYPQQFFPQLTVTCTAYVGTSKSGQPGKARYLDNVSLAGPIPYLVQDAVAFVKKNMRTGGVIREALRYELPDYPLEAVREAVTNALMHRDYSPGARGAQIQLNMYADRMEVQSPGGLFGTVTLDALGKDGVTDSRNASLVKILESTPDASGAMVAENRGSGYITMVQLLQDAHMPAPKPEDNIRYFRLTFHQRYLTDAERGAAAGRSSRQAVLDHLSTVESASSRELAAAAGVSLGGIRRILGEMVDSGQIERMAPLRSPKQRYHLPRPQHNS